MDAHLDCGPFFRRYNAMPTLVLGIVSQWAGSHFKHWGALHFTALPIMGKCSIKLQHQSSKMQGNTDQSGKVLKYNANASTVQTKIHKSKMTSQEIEIGELKNAKATEM